MAEYKTEAQVNYGWGLTLNMTGKAPAVSKRIFSTKADALNYINDSNDSAIAGLILRVINDGANNGAYLVTGTDGNLSLSKLADTASAGENNIIDEITINGTKVDPVNKSVNITIAESTVNGKIKVNGVDVAIHGLKSAAYEEADAFEQAGAVNAAKTALVGSELDAITKLTILGVRRFAAYTAGTVLGDSNDTASDDTVFGAKKYTDAVANTSKIYVDNSITAVSNRLGWEEFN